MLRVDAHQVDLIEAERDYMRLHVGGRSWLIHQTIKSLEERMDTDRFLSIHREKMVRRDGIVGLKHHGEGAWSVDLEFGRARVGTECVSTSRARGAPYNNKKKKINEQRNDTK